MAGGRTCCSRALAAFDPVAIAASLSDEVTIRVAVHDKPLRGKDAASFLFAVLTRELAPFELTEEVVEGDKSVVLSGTSLRGQRAHGLNLVRYQPGGLVTELTVFFRPVCPASVSWRRGCTGRRVLGSLSGVNVLTCLVRCHRAVLRLVCAGSPRS
jgi:hypothetical protein